MDTKLYTVEEANRTLPLIRAIVKDVVAKAKKLEAHRRDRRKILAGKPRLALETPAEIRERLEKLDRDVAAVEAEIDVHRAELKELGCHLKDPLEKGLVDFPAWLGLDVVCLCWHLGETRVKHFHGLKQGFHDRKPIPPDGVIAEPVAPRAEGQARAGG